jgi:hypothetical protein
MSDTPGGYVGQAVLERWCFHKRRVNPMRSAFPELHPASAGLEVLDGRFGGFDPSANECHAEIVAVPGRHGKAYSGGCRIEKRLRRSQIFIARDAKTRDQLRRSEI